MCIRGVHLPPTIMSEVIEAAESCKSSQGNAVGEEDLSPSIYPNF